MASNLVLLPTGNSGGYRGVAMVSAETPTEKVRAPLRFVSDKVTNSYA